MDRFKKIMAIVLVVVLVALYVATFIMGVTGSEYFMGMLVLCIIVPILCYAILMVNRLLRQKGEELRREVEQELENAHDDTE